MNEAQARAAAEAGRSAGPVPVSAVLSWIRQRYIELAEAGKAGPKVPLKDVLVWVAHYQQRTAWVELAVEDSTGKVVRVERSRALFAEECEAKARNKGGMQ